MRPRNRRSKVTERSHRERGMALITVLLLVAVMGTVTAASLEIMNRSVAMANNGRSAMQARHHVRAMEHVAGRRLMALREQYPDRLTLAGGWADTPILVPTEDGNVVLQLSDGSHCFNINALVGPEQGGRRIIDPLGLEHFIGLARAVGIDEQNARDLAFSITDFIDSDMVPQAGGGEDEIYKDGEDSHRTANTLLADPGELAAVKGMTVERLSRLRPHLCALPSNDMVRINVNTLQEEEAPLLAMLAPGQLTLQQARRAISARPEAGWESTDAFWDEPTLSALALPRGASESVDVKSDLFSINMMIDDAGFVSEANILFEVTKGRVRVVNRTWGTAS
jgi:general secretion pathway protein K|tara:strand:- start:22349 stop:23362 length:1014 start_codon:yes stop_codon:yes gene_type:complete